MEERANTLAERKDCYFSLLPDEVFVLILSYLETVPAKLRMELVASRFYSISLAGDLWRSVDLSHAHAKLTDESFCLFAKRLTRCEVLSLARCKALSDESLYAIQTHCALLRELDLTNCRAVTEKGLAGLLSGNCYSTLKALDLSNTTLRKTTFATNVAPLLSNLQVLRFNNPPCSLESSEMFVQSLATHCTNLVELRLMATSQLFDKSILPLKTMTKLRELSLRSIYRLTDKPLIEIVSSCSQLTSLCLSHCDRVTDVAIVALASSLGTNLQTLIMKSLTHVGDAGMAALGQNCPSLTVLDITKTGATDVGIAAIAAGCNNLIQLDLREVRVGDAALTSLGMHCPELRNLDLTGCGSVTDTGLCNLAVGCQHLQRLDLQGLSALTDEGIRGMSTHCTELQRLDLAATSVTGQSLDWLARNCPYLFKLNILQCKNITAQAVTEFLARHPTPDFHWAQNTETGEK